MLLKNVLRFLLLPALLTTLLIAGLSLLIRILLDSLGVEVHEAVLLGWVPLAIGAASYFIFLNHRLLIFFKEAHKGVFGLLVLAFALLLLPNIAVQLAYEDTLLKLSNAATLDEVKPVQKNTVWYLKNDFPQYKMTYLGDYQEYTSGKHPRVEYLSFGLVHFEKENIWLLCEKDESIEQSASENEKIRLYYRIRSECEKQIEALNNTGQKFLLPIPEGSELQYAKKVLNDLNYKGPVPQRIYTLRNSFKTGITDYHFWFLLISFGLNFMFFFLFSVFVRKSIRYANVEMGIINLSAVTAVSAYIVQAPVTFLVLTITVIFFIVEIFHEPNILSVKAEPYLLKWTASNDIPKTHEWYRIATYPFTNFMLYNKFIDPLIFAICASEMEKKMTPFRFLFLLLAAQLAGGFAAAWFGPAINCGLTVFTIAIASYYCFSGFQRHIGFSSWKFIGITLLVFVLILGSVTEFLEYPKLIAAALVGLALGPFLKREA